MTDRRTYNDAFPDPKRGIFYCLSNQAHLMDYWENSIEIPYNQLDSYFCAEYGDRLQSKLLAIYDREGGIDCKNGGASLASVIVMKCGDKWRRLYTAAHASYSPVDNYDMSESETLLADGVESESGETSKEFSGTMTHDLSQTVEDSRTETQSGDNAMTDGVSENVEGNDSEKFHGFNSTSAGKLRSSGSGKTTKRTSTESSGTHNDAMEATANTATATNSTDGTNSAESATISGEKANSSMTVRQLTRKGNIGVTTAAQMIQGEVNLWTAFSFWDTVVSDVANLLTLPIYG